ncbi:MAG: hypothetical protein KDA93_00920 [Planctomycetaceae bacterium]|nr:hypothetical protein [Planctomycetaceae bacterium]
MLVDEKNGFLNMRVMIPAAIVVWAILFWFVHGPMVFAYLAMHALTTGIFLTAIHFADRGHAAASGQVPSLKVATETDTDSPSEHAIAG